MKWPLFENKIGKELSDHRSAVDVDALWSAIEPDVDRINAARKKKRRGFLWLWFAGLAAVGFGIGFYLLNNENETQNGQTTERMAQEISTTNTADADRNILKTLPENEPVVETGIENKEATVIGKIDNPIASTNSEAPKKSTKTNFIRNQASAETPGLANVYKETSEVLGDKTTLENIQSPHETVLEGQKRIPIKIDRLATIPMSLFHVNTDLSSYLIIDEIENTPLVEQVPDLANTLDKRHPASKSPFRFSGSIRAGAGFADRRLGMTDSLGTDYLESRESTEKILETVNAGLLINARHQSGFEISTGFNFARMTELFEIQNTVVDNDSIPGIKYYGVNPNNDTIPVFGMVPHMVTVETHKKYYNRHTFFDIPVIVGYHFGNGDWTFGAEAGVFANLSLKTSGRFLAEDGTDTDIAPIFKSSIGLSYYVGFSAGYKINDKLEVGLSPHVRHFPKSITQTSYTLSQKYTLYSINASARYWF